MIKKKKKKEITLYELFEIAIQKANYPRYHWDGGDDTVRRSDVEIICDPKFWQQLITNLTWRLKLKKDNPKSPHWLKYSTIYFKLVITNGNCKKFWKDFLQLSKL